MLLQLILAVTPFVCPDARAYERALDRARLEVGLYKALTIEVVPNHKAPLALSPTGEAQQIAVGWIPRGPTFDFTIFVRYDMFHAMACGAIRLNALHEVCHIKLEHYRDGGISIAEAAGQEAEADACTRRHLTKGEWRAFNYELYSADQLTKREKIEPPSQSYFPKRIAVPLAPIR